MSVVSENDKIVQSGRFGGHPVSTMKYIPLVDSPCPRVSFSFAFRLPASGSRVGPFALAATLSRSPLVG